YTAVISVTDDGIGIGEDNIAKIFDKNFQENSKQDTPRSGQGMGLYIAKNLVESMNGSISVISRKGEGSTFSIALPAAVRNNTLPSEK
ncbi:MAG TPA: ATP-binding protein, partial [bacterium]